MVVIVMVSWVIRVLLLTLLACAMCFAKYNLSGPMIGIMIVMIIYIYIPYWLFPIGFWMRLMTLLELPLYTYIYIYMKFHAY